MSREGTDKKTSDKRQTKKSRRTGIRKKKEKRRKSVQKNHVLRHHIVLCRRTNEGPRLGRLMLARRPSDTALRRVRGLEFCIMWL